MGKAVEYVWESVNFSLGAGMLMGWSVQTDRSNIVANLIYFFT